MHQAPPEKVRVYFNLHKKKLSVQRKVDGRWLVWQHMNEITLTNVRFKVSEAGRRRVIEQKRKNVHAFIEGEPYHFHHAMQISPALNPRRVKYNPYKQKGFQFENCDSVLTRADIVVINGKEVFAV